MKKRPWLVNLIACTLFIVPLTAIVLVASARSVQVRSTIILDLWVLGIASCVAALGIWRVRPWGFFSFFGFVIGILAGDIHQILKNPASLNVWDIVDGATAAIGIILILQRHVAAPYFNPRIRWWETPTRHRADFEGVLTVGPQTVPASILDVSRTGCFIAGEGNENLAQGQVLSIGLKFEHFYFESPVRVIRKSVSPKGVGLKFEDTSRENKREIKRLLHNLSRRDTPQSATAA